MLIRPAKPDDVPQVIPMVQKICALHESWDPAKHGFRPNVAEMYQSWLPKRATDPQSVFLVADRESAGVPASAGMSALIPEPLTLAPLAFTSLLALRRRRV